MGTSNGIISFLAKHKLITKPSVQYFFCLFLRFWSCLNNIALVQYWAGGGPVDGERGTAHGELRAVVVRETERLGRGQNTCAALPHIAEILTNKLKYKEA